MRRHALKILDENKTKQKGHKSQANSMILQTEKTHVATTARPQPLRSILRNSSRSLDCKGATRSNRPGRRAKLGRSVSFSGDRQGRWQESNDPLNGNAKGSTVLRMPVRKTYKDEDEATLFSGSTCEAAKQFDRRQAPRMPTRRFAEEKASRIPLCDGSKGPRRFRLVEKSRSVGSFGMPTTRRQNLGPNGRTAPSA